MSHHPRISAYSNPVEDVDPGDSETKFSNGKRTARNAYPKAGGNLSKTQKSKICTLAGQAAKALGLTFASAKEADAWRKAEMLRAAKIDSLTRATQRHYNTLVAHFQNLAGDSAGAFETHLKAGKENKRVAMLKLLEACNRLGVAVGYADSICRSKFKSSLDDATPNTVWKVVFELRQRSPKKQPVSPSPETENPF